MFTFAVQAFCVCVLEYEMNEIGKGSVGRARRVRRASLSDVWILKGRWGMAIWVKVPMRQVDSM